MGCVAGAPEAPLGHDVGPPAPRLDRQPFDALIEPMRPREFGAPQPDSQEDEQPPRPRGHQHDDAHDHEDRAQQGDQRQMDGT